MKFNFATILGEPPSAFLVQIVPWAIVKNEKDRSPSIFSDEPLQKPEEGFSIENFCELKSELGLIQTYCAVDVSCLSLAVGINAGLVPNS